MPQVVDDELRKKIKEHYLKGQGSLQDYARIYDVPMEIVLEICGEQHLGQVEMIGDQVDQAEVGRHGTVEPGEVIDVPFSLN